MQIPAGARKQEQACWLGRRGPGSWAKHFSKHINLKSEIHNELVSLVFCSDSNTVKLALKGLPDQARSPGVAIPLETTTGDVIPLGWLFSHNKAASRSLNHKRVASALQGLM